MLRQWLHTSSTEGCKDIESEGCNAVREEQAVIEMTNIEKGMNCEFQGQALLSIRPGGSTSLDSLASSIMDSDGYELRWRLSSHLQLQ